MILAAIAGLLGAAAGFGIGLVLGGLLAGAFSISSFEGGAAYFAGLIALACGVTGFVAASALTLRYQGHRSLSSMAGRIGAIVAVLGAVAAAAMIYRLANVEHFSGAGPRMEFEIRLPPGVPAPDLKRIDAEMQAGSQRSGATFREPRQEDGRTIIPGVIPLYTRTTQRMLVVTLPDRPKLLFRIGLAATPKAMPDYSAWRRVDFLDDGRPDSQPRKPGAGEDFDIRIRVPDWP